MKTRKLTRGLYIATYIGIIIIAVIKIVHKVKGCPCEHNKQRPLFESAEKQVNARRDRAFGGGAHATFDSSRILMPENSGYDQKSLNVFMGETGIGKRMLDAASTAGKIPVDTSKEITLAKHRELDATLRSFAKMEEDKRSAKDLFNA